jgi:hypothetical protein
VAVDLRISFIFANVLIMFYSFPPTFSYQESDANFLLLLNASSLCLSGAVMASQILLQLYVAIIETHRLTTCSGDR